MATAGKLNGWWQRVSYQGQLFALFLAFAWGLVVCFVGFQYLREKQFKAERLNERLQMANAMVIAQLGSLPLDTAALHPMLNALTATEPLRLTIIDTDGQVTFDSDLDTLPLTDHGARPEVAQALRNGTGYTIDRQSQSNGVEYFYSARRAPSGLVVRSALPYSHTLTSLLQADRSFLWFMLAVTVVISLVGAYLAHLLARREERERLRLKRQLTNDINHELKTPVASIQLCLETLRDHPDLPPDRRADFTQRAWANAERLRRLLVDVATITRMDDGGRRVMEHEEVLLNHIIAEAVADEQLAASQAGMTITVHPAQEVNMHGDAGLLNSIFRNLLTNAVAYSGASEVHIALTSVSPKGCVVEFWDNGCGVAEEHLPHLMDRFYRVDAGRSRRAGGTGLGLAIVRNAVLMHGGSIRCFNRPAGGLKFIFSLSRG